MTGSPDPLHGKDQPAPPAAAQRGRRPRLDPAKYASSQASVGGGTNSGDGGGDTQSLLNRIDALPPELRRMVLAAAGPLTQLLHGELPRPLSRTLASVVAADTLRLASDCDAAHEGTDAGGPHATGPCRCARLLPLLPPRADVGWEALFATSKPAARAVRRLPRRTDGRAVAGCDLLLPPHLLPRHPAWPPRLPLATALRAGLLRETADAAVAALADLAVWNYAAEAEPLANAALELVVAAVGAAAQPGVLLECAASLGRTDVVRMLLPHAAEPSVYALSFAGRFNRLPALRLLCSVAPRSSLSVGGAVRGGHIHIVEAMRALDPGIMPSAANIATALRYGNAHVVRWLLADRVARGHPEMAAVKDALAAASAHDLLQIAIDQGVGDPLSPAAVVGAAAGGHTHMLRWLHDTRGEPWNRTEPWPQAAADAAAGGGHLATLQWLHSHAGVVASPLGMAAAAEHGHGEVFEWLWAVRPALRPTVDELAPAAFAGHACVVEFAIKCLAAQMWMSPALSAPVWSPRLLGSPACAQPTDHLLAGTAASAATHEPSTPLLALPPAWLLDQSTGWQLDSRSASDFASPLLGAFIDASALVAEALAGGHVYLAEWLVAVGCGQPHIHAMPRVARFGHVEAARWLRAHAPGTIDLSAVAAACENDHLGMVEFLVCECGVAVTDKAFGKASACVRAALQEWFPGRWTMWQGCIRRRSDMTCK
ncbi:hypothetical protein HK105_203538 [Polyrhizophydium stewartii]|uniref:Ankyrin repeat protein n=1 Tax=Polyrhizophydium stewartii TaxID=2732419 RepID=A0ABR4NBD8_9FUNG